MLIFIHGELDIKIFILFILRRLPSPVDPQTLLELCTRDTGVGYFDYAQYLSELVDTGHAERTENGRYSITEKGARNGEAGETSLPYSVRKKTAERLAPLIARMRREKLITCSHEIAEDGSCMASFALSDGKGELVSMRLLMADEAQAQAAERLFRRGAEGVYGRIIEILSEKQGQ